MNEFPYYETNPAQSSAPRFRFSGLPGDRPIVNIVLFFLTIISTYLTGGWSYCLPIISILLAHEMGHYWMCRRYGIKATLPFFIPLPFVSPFGTLGAVIQMRGVMPNRRALFDIGAAGPIAGLILTVPFTLWGLAHSQVILSQQVQDSNFFLGESLLFKLFSWMIFGKLPEGSDIILHPMAYAGWVGLLVTALNLIPIGQLDGGHIFYSMFGARSRGANLAFIGTMGALTVIYPGWALWFLILLFFGRRHPSPFDDYTPLDNKRRLLGWIIFTIFIVSFTPIPFKF